MVRVRVRVRVISSHSILMVFKLIICKMLQDVCGCTLFFIRTQSHGWNLLVLIKKECIMFYILTSLTLRCVVVGVIKKLLCGMRLQISGREIATEWSVCYWHLTSDIWHPYGPNQVMGKQPKNLRKFTLIKERVCRVARGYESTWIRVFSLVRVPQTHSAHTVAPIRLLEDEESQTSRWRHLGSSTLRVAPRQRHLGSDSWKSRSHVRAWWGKGKTGCVEQQCAHGGLEASWPGQTPLSIHFNSVRQNFIINYKVYH